MKFSFNGQTDQQPFEWFADGLRRMLEANGHSFVDAAESTSFPKARHAGSGGTDRPFSSPE
jgi:hypothetical protein